MRTFYKLSILPLISSVFVYANIVSAEASTQYLSAYTNQVLDKKLSTLLGPQAKFEITQFNNTFDRIKIDNQILLASKDGQYLFWGKVIDTSSRADLIELANQQHRQALVASIPREKLLTYSAKKEQHKLTIFTDIDCPFCRKLHTQIKDLNQQGVTVDYVMLPRGKAGSVAFIKTVNALCAANPQAAMDSAMHNGNFESSTQANQTCVNNLKAQQALAQTFGFSATPTILFANGEIVPGLMTTKEILNKLNTL